MSDRQSKLHELLLQNLAELNLTQIAATYREVLDEVARRNSSMLEVLSSLVASEMTLRRQKALQRRILQAKLPKLKTLAEYKFESETLRKAIKPTSSRIQSQIQAQTALAPSGCAVKQSPETCAPFGV